ALLRHLERRLDAPAPAGPRRLRQSEQPCRRRQRRQWRHPRRRCDQPRGGAEEHTMSDGLRFYATGNCDGYGELVAALAGYAGLELVGQSADVRGVRGALSGGHLDVVLHATRGTAFPADEYAAIREHTQ